MSTSRDGESSADELRALRSDVEKLTRDFRDLVGTLKCEGEDRFSEFRNRVRATVHEKAQAVREKAEEVAAAAAERARWMKTSAEEHPFTTAFSALCVGVVLGAVLKGRNGHNS
jgi:ElaB/YqjD/DUF883 family membrane-anchored ribosome-binding protein